MKRRICCGILIIALINMANLVLASGEGIKIPLTVKNTLSHDRTMDCVIAGIPIPKEIGLYDTEGLVAQDSGNIKYPVQAIATARWGGKTDDITKPVKWLRVTLPITVSALQEKELYIVTGDIQKEFYTLSLIEEGPERIIIQTEKAAFTINRHPFRVIDRVTIEDTPPFLNLYGKGITLTDQQGLVYSSAFSEPSLFAVEEKGPEKIEIRVEGTLAAESGKNGLDYTLVMTFLAGKETVGLLCTLGNHNKAAIRQEAPGSYDVFDFNGANSLSFEGAAIELGLVTDGDLRLFTHSGAEFDQAQDIVIYQDSSGTDYWNRYREEDSLRPGSQVSFRGYRISKKDLVLESDNWFQGWADFSGDGYGITVALVDFWQNFPKAISVSDNRMVQMELFPNEYKTFFNFRVGEEKTHEIFVRFHGDEPIETTKLQAESMLNPLIQVPDPVWYADSKAAGIFSPSEEGTIESRMGRVDLNDQQKYEYYNDRTIMPDPSQPLHTYYPFDSLWTGSTESPGAIEYFNFYGWHAWGNQPLDFEMYGEGKAGFFNAKYDLDWGAWIQYLRSGDRRWADMARAISRNSEQLMLHDVETETGWDVERWKNAIFGHSQHYETGEKNGQRNYLGPVIDTAYGVRGAALHFYLTGYPPSRRYVEKAGDYAYEFYLERREGAYLWQANERWEANLLSILVEAFALTGDIKYQKLASEVIAYYAPEKQPYINGPVEGATQYVRPWMLAMYLSALGRYENIVSEYSMEEEASLTRERLVKFARWMKEHVLFRYNGWLTTGYNWWVNGVNSQEDHMLNNWMLVVSDVMAYAYRFTGDEEFLKDARDLFATGVNNPFYENSPLVYSTVKEAVNHAVFGHVYLASRDDLQDSVDGDEVTDPDDSSDEEEGQEEGTGDGASEESNEPGIFKKAITDDVTITTLARDGNYGATPDITVYNGLTPAYRALLKIDISEIPQEAVIESAFLNIYCIKTQQAPLVVRALNKGWSEGSGTYGNTTDGATWNSAEKAIGWDSPGGDFDMISDFGHGKNGIAAQFIPAQGWISVDITKLAETWKSGSNYGLGIMLPDDQYYKTNSFASSENENNELRPWLEISYSFEK